MKKLAALLMCSLVTASAMAGEDSTDRYWGYGPAWYETPCGLACFRVAGLGSRRRRRHGSRSEARRDSGADAQPDRPGSVTFTAHEEGNALDVRGVREHVDH